jgi:hypothetical protein
VKTSSAKAKGRRLQQWVAQWVGIITGLPVGVDEDISSREMGQAGMDIRLSPKARKLFPYAIECKNSERWSIPEWWNQARHNAGGLEPLLVVSRNRTRPLVVLDAEVFFTILGGGQ